MPEADTDISSLYPDLKSILTFRLAKLQNGLNTHAANLLKAHSDLSLAEWRVINVVNLLKNTTMTKLSQEAVIDKGQLSRNLKRLAEKGYVHINASQDDARQQIICLSEQGKQIYSALLPQMRQRQHNLVQNVAPEDLATFDHVLEQLSENVKTMKTPDLPAEK